MGVLEYPLNPPESRTIESLLPALFDDKGNLRHPHLYMGVLESPILESPRKPNY